MWMKTADTQVGNFDLVVLSVGMRPAEHSAKLANVLDVALNEYGFVKSSPRNPLLTTQGRHLCERRLRVSEGYTRDGDPGIRRGLRSGLHHRRGPGQET